MVEEDTDAAGKQEKASKSQPIVNKGTKMFEHCVARYAEGMSRVDMSEHVTISDVTWKEIVKSSNSQQS